MTQFAAYGDPAGKTVLDIGGGAGYFTAEFRARGADCYLFEPDPAELFSGSSQRGRRRSHRRVLAAGP